MDVRVLKVSLVFLGLVLSACGQPAKLADATNSLQSASCLGAQAIKNEVIVEWEDGRYTLEKVNDIDRFVDDFVAPQISAIKRVQYNQRIHQMDFETQAVDVVTTTDTNSWGQDRIQAASVWNQGVLGQNIAVAVVDAYVDDTHTQLQNRVEQNPSALSGDYISSRGFDMSGDHFNFQKPDGSVDPYPNAHGTHVAGIIAGEHMSGGVQGIAPQAKIIISSFLDHSGGGTLDGAIQALEYAYQRGAKIINASWGTPGCASSLQNKVSELDQKGIMFISAAGNNSLNLDYNSVSPASFRLPRQITVGSGSFSDLLSYFSNYSDSIVHLLAPGESIYSSTPGNTWQYMSGTSMATPFVSGVAALLLSAYPSADPLKVKKAIMDSVDIIPGKESKTITRGRINAAKALVRLRQLMTP